MQKTRPTITITYAQSLDGSIARQRGEPLLLSCHDSLVMTHRLRAQHDAILIGAGTLLADDPQLTVRHVEGENPRPVVLDSRLRCPADARLLASRPIIATTLTAAADRAAALTAAGATVVRFAADDAGRVALRPLLAWLSAQNIATLMIEGGARTISSFLAAHLVDRAIITIAPSFVGGLNVIENMPHTPRLVNVACRSCGNDIIIEGDVVFG